MQFRVLGSMSITSLDGQFIQIGSRTRRLLLAAFLCRANRPVPTHELAQAIWNEAPPQRAAEGMRVHIHHLRRHLGADRLVRAAGGYQLRVDPGELDSDEFVRLADSAKALSQPERSRDTLRQALAIWRGSAYAGLDDDEPVRTIATMLNEKRLTAYEDCFDIELGLGLHTEICAELHALSAEHPYRERLRAQLMLSLYRSHRQAEALAKYDETRRLLAEELGIGPGQQLQDLHARILRNDPSLLHTAGGRLSAAPTANAARAQPPSQLPAAPANFTGRRGYLDELNRIAERGHTTNIVIITALAGMAGVGKTALASHWAHLSRNRFPDGQLYINLGGSSRTAPLRTIDALALFLRALGVAPEQVPVDVEEAASLYRTMLSGRRALVLLDNAHSVEQVRPLLPGEPGCLALVTSRDRLSGLIARDGAQRISVDVLSPDESAALLRDLLGKERTEREPGAVTALAQACGHLPLALRIAAANLCDGQYQSIIAYVADMTSDDRLGALDVEDDPESSVRAAFSLSYVALEPPARRVFRLLGLAPVTDIATGTAAALADLDERRADRLINRLAQAHLIIQPGPGRYALHDLLREFAAERADDEETAADRMAARDRLFGYLLARADAGARQLYPHLVRAPAAVPTTAEFADTAQAAAWLDAERRNLVSTITDGAERGPYESAWRLADALRGYYYLRSHHTDWSAAGEAGLAAATAAESTLGKATAYLSIGTCLWNQGALHRAVNPLERARKLATDIDWVDGRASALGNLGNVYRALGQLDHAVRNFVETAAIYRETGQLGGLASALGNLGLIYWEQGDLSRAVGQYSEALPLHRQAGSRLSESNVLGALAEACHSLGRTDEARAYLAQGLEISEGMRDLAGTADHHRCLAAIHRDCGELAEALRLAETALALARKAGSERYETNALSALASVRLRLGEPYAALEHDEHALEIAERAGFVHPALVARIGVAAAAHGLGDLDRARREAEHASATARAGGRRMLEAHALTVLSMICADRGEAVAVSYAEQATQLAVATGHRVGEANARGALMRARATAGSRQ